MPLESNKSEGVWIVHLSNQKLLAEDTLTIQNSLSSLVSRLQSQTLPLV